MQNTECNLTRFYLILIFSFRSKTLNMTSYEFGRAKTSRFTKFCFEKNQLLHLGPTLGMWFRGSRIWKKSLKHRVNRCGPNQRMLRVWVTFSLSSWPSPSRSFYADVQCKLSWPLQCVAVDFVLYVCKPNNANRHNFCPWCIKTRQCLFWAKNLSLQHKR